LPISFIRQQKLVATVKNCFCGNKFTFEQCCKPIIDGKVDAINAEILMRSRYSAYVVKNYPYILQTYASTQRTKLSVRKLVDSALDTKWLALQVLDYRYHEKTAQVEFKAIYQIDVQYYVMHELSDFVFEGGKRIQVNLLQIETVNVYAIVQKNLKSVVGSRQHIFSPNSFIEIKHSRFLFYAYKGPIVLILFSG
jgi:SEC-C motif-containing protein